MTHRGRPPRPRGPTGFAALAVVLALGVLSPPAHAVHASLIASRPAEGDTLRAAPSEIWLNFTEPIEGAVSEILLLASDGTSLPLAVRTDPANVRALVARLSGSLAPGGYRVVWRVVSADGHPVEGSFVFYVGDPGALLAPPPPAPHAHRGHGAQAGPGSWSNALLRGLATGVLLALAGLLAFVAWLAPAPGPARAALALAILAPFLLAAEALAWTALASPEGALSRPALADALHTLPGRLAAIRLGLAALALWALVLARRVGLAAALAMAAVLVSAGIGHSVVRSPAWSVPAKGFHLLAVALWLGGLVHIVTGGLAGSAASSVAARVSAIALPAVVVVALTGAIQSALLLPSPADLVRSAYGLLVLGKILGLGALMLFGARHRTRLIPALHGGASADALTRSVRWETVVMTIVLLVAGLLAHTPMPEG